MRSSLVLESEPQEIPWKKKADDLPPAVAEQLIDLYRAGRDVVAVMGCLPLVEDRPARLDRHSSDNPLKRLQFVDIEP
jgi:hypothetical protein